MRVAHMQSRGEQGARDFDKLMFTLPIPRFDAREPLHSEIAVAGREAESIAAGVGISEGTSFLRARTAVRAALRHEGITTRIVALVDDLLGPDPDGPVAPRVPRLQARVRERLLREAQESSRKLPNDLREQTLLDELEGIQGDSADDVE